MILRHIATGTIWHGTQIFRAASRLLNALLLGEGDTTFSAYSWRLMVDGQSPLSRRWGAYRVDLIDCILGDGHCRESYDWHKQRGLFEVEK